MDYRTDEKLFIQNLKLLDHQGIPTEAGAKRELQTCHSTIIFITTAPSPKYSK
jgi:hypothetical protein